MHLHEPIYVWSHTHRTPLEEGRPSIFLKHYFNINSISSISGSVPAYIGKGTRSVVDNLARNNAALGVNARGTGSSRRTW